MTSFAIKLDLILQITRHSLKGANLSCTDIDYICTTSLSGYIFYHDDDTIPKIGYLSGQEKFHTVNPC
jgi:hypothetical protein